MDGNEFDDFPDDCEELWAEALVALACEIMEPEDWGELPAAEE